MHQPQPRSPKNVHSRGTRSSNSIVVVTIQPSPITDAQYTGTSKNDKQNAYASMPVPFPPTHTPIHPRSFQSQRRPRTRRVHAKQNTKKRKKKKCRSRGVLVGHCCTLTVQSVAIYPSQKDPTYRTKQMEPRSITDARQLVRTGAG